MADAQDSKSCEGSFMRVRPPPPAPNKNKTNLENFQGSFLLCIIPKFLYIVVILKYFVKYCKVKVLT